MSEFEQNVAQSADASADLEEFSLGHERVSPGKVQLNASFRGELFHCDKLDIRRATARAKFLKDLAAKGRARFQIEFPADVIERNLLEIAALFRDDDPDALPREYRAVEAPDDPDASGIYREGPEGSVRLTNFVALIDEDTKVVDEIDPRRQFRGHISLNGKKTDFVCSPGEFASKDDLKKVLYDAAGAKAEFLSGSPEELRTAISRLSQPVERTVITASGWNEDDSIYLVPNGFVDAQRFHRAKPDDPIRVDLSGEEAALGLGLKYLRPHILTRVKRHLVRDFLQLHNRPVMFVILGFVALAVLERHANRTQRVALWLNGLTGAGKSFVAKLAANFYGDFGLGERFTTWASTANRIEKAGYFFRDALFLVDDFKLGMSSPQQAVRILQTYADGTGRGRLQADARTAKTWPIRGLLVSTGEDLPQNNSSTLARMIVLNLANRPKDIERGVRCQAECGFYRGVTADFIAHLIRSGRLSSFATTVSTYYDKFYEGIAGRQNDARIAHNFAKVAAAFAEIAYYLRDQWPEWERSLEGFVDHDLIVLRDEMLGTVMTQQPSDIFVTELRSLIGFGRVRLPDSRAGLYTGSARNGDLIPIIGCRAPDRVIEISISLALAEVQKSLANQRRPPLQVTEQTLIGQLADDGFLVDDRGNKITAAHKGNKTFRRRLGDAQLRLARFSEAKLLGDEVGNDSAVEPDADDED